MHPLDHQMLLLVAVLERDAPQQTRAKTVQAILAFATMNPGGCAGWRVSLLAAWRLAGLGARHQGVADARIDALTLFLALLGRLPPSLYDGRESSSLRQLLAHTMLLDSDSMISAAAARTLPSLFPSASPSTLAACRLLLYGPGPLFSAGLVAQLARGARARGTGEHVTRKRGLAEWRTCQLLLVVSFLASLRARTMAPPPSTPDAGILVVVLSFALHPSHLVRRACMQALMTMAPSPGDEPDESCNPSLGGRTRRNQLLLIAAARGRLDPEAPVQAAAQVLLDACGGARELQRLRLYENESSADVTALDKTQELLRSAIQDSI